MPFSRDDVCVSWKHGGFLSVLMWTLSQNGISNMTSGFYFYVENTAETQRLVGKMSSALCRTTVMMCVEVMKISQKA